MSVKSWQNQKGSTSSGHGTLGMGGHPDDPRDLEGGHEQLADDDRQRPAAQVGQIRPLVQPMDRPI